MRYGPGEQAIMKDAIKWIGAQAPWRRTDERALAPSQQAWVARLQRVGAEERQVGLTAVCIRETRRQAAEALDRVSAGPQAGTLVEFLVRSVRRTWLASRISPIGASVLAALTAVLALSLYLVPDVDDPYAGRRTPGSAVRIGDAQSERALDFLRVQLVQDVERFQERHFVSSARGLEDRMKLLRISLEQTALNLREELSGLAQDAWDTTGGLEI
jgi:hypothetical protein